MACQCWSDAENSARFLGVVVEQKRERGREPAVVKRRRKYNLDRIVPDISPLINFMSNSLSPNSKGNITYNSNTKHVDVLFLPGSKKDSKSFNTLTSIAQLLKFAQTSSLAFLAEHSLY